MPILNFRTIYSCISFCLCFTIKEGIVLLMNYLHCNFRLNQQDFLTIVELHERVGVSPRCHVQCSNNLIQLVCIVQHSGLHIQIKELWVVNGVWKVDALRIRVVQGEVYLVELFMEGVAEQEEVALRGIWNKNLKDEKELETFAFNNVFDMHWMLITSISCN